MRTQAGRYLNKLTEKQVQKYCQAETLCYNTPALHILFLLSWTFLAWILEPRSSSYFNPAKLQAADLHPYLSIYGSFLMVIYIAIKKTDIWWDPHSKNPSRDKYRASFHTRNQSSNVSCSFYQLCYAFLDASHKYVMLAPNFQSYLTDPPRINAHN